MDLDILAHPIALAVPDRLVRISWYEHIPFAFFLVDLHRPATVVELGTQCGDSYCAFCQAVKLLSLDARCYAIDTWAGDAQTGFYGPEILADLRAHHDPRYAKFSTLIQSTFDQARGRFETGSIDMLHIDGCHTYEAVKHDFETWLPAVSGRGVVLFHDIAERQGDYGAWRFWEEITTKYPHFEFAHGHGLGVLQVGSQAFEVGGLCNCSQDDQSTIRHLFERLGRTVGQTEVATGSQQGQDYNRIADLEAELSRIRKAMRDSKALRVARWLGSLVGK